MPYSNSSHRVFCRSTYMLCLVIGFLFLSLSPTKAELLYNRPVKTDTWKGAEIEYLGGTVIVQINSDADSAAVESLFAAHGCYAIHYSGWNGWALAGFDTSASLFDKIDSLAASALINLAEPNALARPCGFPNDPYFQDSSQWNLWNTGKHGVIDADIDALEAWEIETGDPNLIIGVIDCGFPYSATEDDTVYEPGDYCHEDLNDTTKYILGYNCCDSIAGCRSADIAFMGDWGGVGGCHGTAVTGVIAATPDNSLGVAGILWDCKIYVMKLYLRSEWPISWQATVYNMTEAINLAVDYGAKIINISAGTGASVDILEDAVERANSAGCLIVASAGNVVDCDTVAGLIYPAAFATYADRDWNCCDTDCPDYPDSCGHRNVIAVGSSTKWGEWSCHAVVSGEESKITVLAPDDIIKTTYCAYENQPYMGDSCAAYSAFTGTSISAPHVSGVAGLLQSYAMSGGDTLSPYEIRTLIEQTADDLSPEGWDDFCGFGQVNALRALMAIDGYSPSATGYLRANATWGDTLGDTLYVLGDVVIPEGCTLTIDQGAVIKFLTNDREDFGGDSTKCEIVVQGKLVIEGEPDSLVQLMSCSDSPSDSDWYGITVDSTGSIEMEYCVFQDAAVPIPWDSTDSYTMNHVTFKHCQTWPAIVDSAETLRVVDCTIQDFDTAIIVNSWGALEVDGCQFDDGEMGVLAKSESSAKLKDSEIRDVTTGIYFNNSANDSVVGCTFRDNVLRGIIVPDNDNIFVDDCIFVDSTGSDTLIHGIWSSSDITVKNSFFEGYEYGIKVLTKKEAGSPSPLIEDCGFYNLGKVGIWAASGSDPTIKKCCFKGSFGKAAIEVNSGDPYIRQCYMASENDEILIGMLFTSGASGEIRKTTIWDYDSCAVEIVGFSTHPDFGNSDSGGCNWFEETDGKYFRSNSNYTILAKSNYWDVNDGDTAGIREKIVGNVDIHPILGKCDRCFPYYADLCSDLDPPDPDIPACKIVAAEQEDDEGEKEKEKGCAPREFALSQNYPNPFNPQTVIKYDLPEPVHVELAVYNALGQKVRTLVDEKQEEGYKTIIWHGKTDQGEEVASGIYFFKLRTGDFEQTKKMILLR